MITVIIPSYNQKQYLPDALQSVLDQTVKPDEIIVIDDGSNDGSLEVAKSYPVKIISQVNKGLASARNTGIMNATSEFILPLDADDILMDKCIEKITEKIKETNADIVAPSFKCFGINNQEVILQGNIIAKSFVYANRLAYFSAFRRSRALAIGGYSPRMIWGWEDMHFWIDLLKHGATVAVIQEPLVLYRTKENSMIGEANKHADELWAQIRKDHPEIYTL